MNFTEWTEMNLELILMFENDIAELRKMYSVHFKKDLKMCLVNVKKRFFQKILLGMAMRECLYFRKKCKI